MRTLLITIGLVMLTLLAGTAGAVGSAYMHAPSVDNPIVTAGCTVRFDERTPAGFTKPTIHVNQVHYCVGVNSVRVDYASGALVVDLQGARPVMAALVQSDETLTARGIHCGPSGGVSDVWIKCYRDGRQVKAQSSAMFGLKANVFIEVTSWDKTR